MANVLISCDGTYKLGDFGLAKIVASEEEEDLRQRRQQQQQHQVHQTLCGTPSSLAPEVVSGERYSVEVDVWAVGVLAYTLLVGRPPFEGRDVRDTVENINRLRYNMPEEGALSEAATSLLRSTLTHKQNR